MCCDLSFGLGCLDGVDDHSARAWTLNQPLRRAPSVKIKVHGRVPKTPLSPAISPPPPPSKSPLRPLMFHSVRGFRGEL